MIIPNTHPNWINLLVVVEVLNNDGKFTIKVSTLITAVAIPMISMYILKLSVHGKGKNMGGHTKLPGELLYL